MKNEAKMAFLILAHNDPPHLKKLIYALDDPRFDIYVHVDAKADIRQFAFEDYRLRHSRLCVLDNRIKVYWADYSIVQATLGMYRAAFANGPYIRYITLSGNDYPLVSNDSIYQQLCQTDKEFIMGSPTEQPEKVTGYYFNRAGIFGKMLTHLFRLLHITRNKAGLVMDGARWDIYFAPQWHALSGDCVAYLLDTLQRHREVIDRYFKYSFAPDELLIPTMVFHHSVFKERALRSSFPKGTHYNDMTAIHYINYEPVVQVFTERDAEKLLHSGKLFARKLKSGASDKLTDMIDAAARQSKTAE